MSIPDFIWAQNKENIFLTIQQNNCSNVEIDLTETSINISFISNSKNYSCNLDLFGTIDISSSSWENNRNINFCLKRVENEYWTFLLKNNILKNKIKTDWSRWVDEDDSEDEKIDMSGMPGMPGMDMQGMEAMMKNMGGMEGLQNMMGAMNPNADNNVDNDVENDIGNDVENDTENDVENDDCCEQPVMNI